MNPTLQIISAGAGSGKTYRLTNEMVALLKSGVRASGIIATTFTKKAAAELQERVRVKLLEEGMTEQANDLTNALIGTVHGLGVKLLQRFAYEAGVSPEVSIIADEDTQLLFNQSLATVLTNERVEQMENLSNRLGLNKKDFGDWRKTVRQLTDIARANDFDKEVLEKSKQYSFESFLPFIGEVQNHPQKWWTARLQKEMGDAVDALEANEDSTKVTATATSYLKGKLRELKLRDELYWHEWVKISKLKTGAKSREAVADLIDFAKTHESHPQFHSDIRDFINLVFEIAVEAIEEYDRYKKMRGLIDYTDMEVLVKKLLRNERVQEVLREELDLLMVDEFQDTSPLQLEIFWQLSQFADHSIWVGDPKQSIYGFRGADPKLMLALIEKQGGVKPENIQEYSWRSREDIVAATNAIFTKAFADLPEEQVALKARRLAKAKPGFSANKADEPDAMGLALHHWHLEYDGEGKRLPGKPWTENGIAFTLKKMLDRGLMIYPKDEPEPRRARPGDVAILCRSNYACQDMADALHRAGLKAAISRAGLLETPESKLILACLKYILNKYDSLSVAEMLLLTGEKSLETIVEERIDWLARKEAKERVERWSSENKFIGEMDKMREDGTELSSAEILNYLLEEADLRRIIVAWGKTEQRLANVDMLRKFALQYEDNCNRLHTAASLGGFLLWLNQLAAGEQDKQGSGETPDTVRVMTYHKSKGLEFPVTICHSLEAKLRDNVFGISLVSEREDIDLDNILGHRRIRFWVNPYADQSRNTLLEERLQTSEEKLAATRDALAEEARVMYVGITRARDYLVIPTRARPTLWLNRVFHNGKEDYPVLDPNADVSPFVWKNRILNVHTEVFPYASDFTTAEMSEPPVFFPAEPTGKEEGYAPYRIDLNERFEDEYSIKTDRSETYAAPLPIEEEEDTAAVIACFKAFLTADNLAYSSENRLQNAKDLMTRFEVPEEYNPKRFLQQAEAFFTALKVNFNIKKVWRRYPLRIHHKGRLFETKVDMLLQTDAGFVIIEHSTYAGEAKTRRHKIEKEFGNYFFFAKKAVRENFDTPQVRTVCHFAAGGAFTEAEVRERVTV